MGKVILAVLGFLAQCALYAVVYAIIVAALFLPFGVVGWAFAKDAGVLLVPSGFGIVVGALMGIGQVFIERFSERPPEAEQADENAAGKVADFYLGPLKPDWLAGAGLAFGVVKWFATKDFSKQKPGRWKRALIGAIGLSLVALFLLAVAGSVSPARSDSSSLWLVGAIMVLVAALIGAVAGALTDSL